MKINNEFTVGAPIQQAWDTMVNLERIAPCLPGAAIQEEKDEGEYDGTMKVKIGPMRSTRITTAPSSRPQAATLAARVRPRRPSSRPCRKKAPVPRSASRPI
jgi:carbon monoxide dehydrogenase subunit G